MSAKLCWRPKARTRETLPYALQSILREALGESPRTFSNKDIPYLTGLRDAKIEGAQELIDAIEKHEEVELWLEY